MSEAEDMITTGVVGVGYLGKFHAEKYASSNPRRNWPGLSTLTMRAQEIGESVGAPALRIIETCSARSRASA